MGQHAIGPAILQHLEGFHVQTLDLSTLVNDSTRVRYSLSQMLLADYPTGCRSSMRAAVYRGQTAQAVYHLHSFLVGLGQQRR